MKRRPFAPMRAVSLIEPLEDRIAPAAVIIAANGRSASYTDTAGDTVVVTTSKGTFKTAQFIFDPNAAGQLTELLLSGHKDFSGANIGFSVLPAAGNAATVNIGYIDALSLNIGSVTVPGDLGRIDVGGGKTAAALGKLTVYSLGANISTQGGLTGASIESNITGTVGTVNVLGNLDGLINAQDYKSHPGTGNINRLNIGGSLDGNTSSEAGEIAFTGTLGTTIIGGGIEGGPSGGSGSIAGNYGTLSKIGSVTVKGSVPDDPNPNPNPSLPGTSILGGSGALSGSISAATVGSVVVAGSVLGGTGTASGGVQAGVKLAKVTIDGSLIGGSFPAGSPGDANNSGLVFGGAIGNVLIKGSIVGGSGISSGEVSSTGLVNKVTVMGSVIGGSAGQSTSDGVAGVIRGNALGSVVIDGSLIGGNLVSGDANQTGSFDGAILSSTTIGSVAIGKNIVGGSGASSGLITTAAGAMGTLTVGGADKTDGSIIGGSGASSGLVNIAGALNKVSLTHNLTGGSGSQSGQILIDGSISSVKIGGSVTGGAADFTGNILANGLLKSASIAGNLTGGSSGATILINTGYVQANGIGTMTIKGSLVAGTAGAGGLDTSGAIRSTISIGNLAIGSIVGNATNPAIISAVGQASLISNATTDVAIKTLTIKGNTTYGDILAGYNTDTQNSTQLLGTGVNADAQIGTVTIGGNYEATNIIAGVGPGATGFGTASSAALSGPGVSDLPTIISKISKVIIEGTVVPTPNNSDTYGIAAQYIASATVSKAKLTLLAGPDNDTFANGKDLQLPASTGDVFLYEV